MIDPTNITRFDRTDAELEEMLLFCVSVAGKTARIIAQALEEFLKAHPGMTPFEKIRRLEAKDGLAEAVRSSRLGKHTRLTRLFSALAGSGIDLLTCRVDELEAFHGIGPKTARYFVLHSRPNQRLVVVDTHILRYLAEEGFENLPKATPTGQRYRDIEADVLAWLDAKGRSPAEFDLTVWNGSSKSGASSNE